MTMTNINRAIFAALATVTMFSMSSCQKPDNGTEGTEPETTTNYFTYDEYSFDINSVVKYEQGDNTVEFWLSPMIGATTIAEIEREGDYVVLKTNKAYLGKRDRFSESTSKNSSISFGANQKFTYGDAGTAYIQASIQADQVNIEFLAQNLYTKASIKAAIQGSYNGKFTTQTEQGYNNEWGINRNRETISSVVYTSYEVGGNSEIALLDESENERVKISIAPSLIGKTINFPYTGESSNLKVTYNETIDFNLNKATGSISTALKEGEFTLHLDATSGEKRIRAIYKGSYENDIVKPNRYIFNHEGSSLIEKDSDEIVKLQVENDGNVSKFILWPNEAGYYLPTLIVPSNIINGGKKSFADLTGWKFEFADMQVEPFENEYKPYPAATDWIEINKVGNTYEVEFVLSSIATGMSKSNIDVYYKGEVK